MRCTDTLLRNHHDIALMTRVLPAVAARLTAGHYVDPAMLAGLDRFFQQLVAGTHFPAGTLLLFPRLPAIRPDEAARTALRRDACIAPLDLLHGIVERMATTPLEALADELVPVAARCADTLTTLLETERALLERVRHLPASGEDERLAGTFLRFEHTQLGVTGREWMAQLAADYADIAGTWPHWPATAGAPDIRSGRALESTAPRRQAPH
jgi:hypothetical protein